MEDGSLGCLLEITRRGAAPVKLPNGEERAFLEDGDEVVMRGYCEREGLRGLVLESVAGGLLKRTSGAKAPFESAVEWPGLKPRLTK